MQRSDADGDSRVQGRATETALWERATLGRGNNCFMCDSLATAMDCTARWLDLSSMRLTHLHRLSLNALDGYPAASLSEYFGQRLPVHVAHDGISRAPSPEARAVGNDPGMPLEVDQGSHPFAKAPLPVAYREFRWQVRLDRYDLIQLVVARLVDHLEAAMPEDCLEGEAAQHAPLQQRGPATTPSVCHESSLSRDSQGSRSDDG